MTPSSPTGRSSSTRSSRPDSATIELGPFGYLPTNPEQLTDELGKRGLSLTAGTVGAATHRGQDAFEASRRDAFEVCELLAAMDVEHLVVLPEMFTDLQTGELNQPAELTAEQWRDLVDGQNRLGRMVKEQFDIQLGFHPHVDTHVETQHFIDTFLQDTDPSAVALCLDTGHVEYCAGDNREVVRRHPDRISYIHLKQVNPAVAAKARADRVGFYEAVQRGAMVEPPLGAPDMKPLLDDLAALNRDLRLIIEQDMYPANARQRQGDRHPHPAVLHQHRPAPGRAMTSTTKSQRKEQLT